MPLDAYEKVYQLNNFMELYPTIYEDSKVVKVIPHENLTLSLWFKKDPEQEYCLNFKALIDKNKFFEPLNNVDLFMQAHLLGESIGWNDLLDIGAEWLYMDADPVKNNNQ